MAIAIDEPRSDGWWLSRLAKKLGDKDRLERFNLLSSYLDGNSPLPVGADTWRDAFVKVQKHSRTNFAELIVDATRERMIPSGFRTSADGDATGDTEAWNIWRRAGCDVLSADCHEQMLGLSESYMVVGDVDDETGVPLITVEDPREVIVETDPAAPRRRLAALKLFHDDLEQRDYAYLWLPGELRVARSDSLTGERRTVHFSPSSWSWDDERSKVLTSRIGARVPVVPFINRRGFGEFETHTDLLDRINHMLLERMVIGMFQAYRQRAAIGLPLVYPKGHKQAGELIDYAEIFVAHPGSMWQLPEGSEMWESGQTDMTPILAAVKDDVEHLAAVTRTPMHMLMPEGENQTAEGAQLAREGLVFKVRDRMSRARQGWAEVMSLAFRWMGDAERADLAFLEVLWEAPEFYSLSERADAATKLGASTVQYPWRSLMVDIVGRSPDDVDRMERERTQEQAMQAALAAATAPTQPTGVPGGGGGENPPSEQQQREQFLGSAVA